MWTLLLILAQSANPHTGADDVKIGQEYYRLRCAECHGAVGEGGRGPNLAAGVFYHGGEDQDVFNTIRNGIRGTEMPGFGSSEERLWQVVAFIRSLNQAATPEEASGDATRGKALFQGKGDCLSCHRVGPEGGFSGPGLGSVGSQRSLAHLRTSMLDPNDDVRRRYWLVTVTGPNGARTLGNVLNEDRHSLQLLDLRGKLRSFDKATLQTIERDPSSMMQSYDGMFDESEMEDLLSYLVSLRRGRRGRSR